MYCTCIIQKHKSVYCFLPNINTWVIMGRDEFLKSLNLEPLVWQQINAKFILTNYSWRFMLQDFNLLEIFCDYDIIVIINMVIIPPWACIRQVRVCEQRMQVLCSLFSTKAYLYGGNVPCIFCPHSITRIDWFFSCFIFFEVTRALAHIWSQRNYFAYYIISAIISTLMGAQNKALIKTNNILSSFSNSKQG